jgi:hypothetical protein
MKRISLFLLLFLAAATPAPVAPEWTAVHAVVHGFARSNSDLKEDTADLAEARRNVTNAVFAATAVTTERAALLAAGHAETLFALRLGLDECRPGECDDGLARGYWQVHEPLCPDAWAMDPGAERAKLEAVCALRFLRYKAGQCGSLKAAVSGFTGDCRPRDRAIRDRAYEVALDVLTRGEWPAAPQFAKPAGDVPRAVIARGVELTKRLSMGDTVVVDETFGAMVDWHWHDPSGEHRPKGWHRGVTFYRHP